MASGHVGTRGMPREEREAQLVASALALFGERGYHQVSMADVAARAGVSKPLVHAYFGTKDALYLRCASDVAQRLLAAIEPVVAAIEPGLPMAVETMRVTFATVIERPRDWAVVYDARLPGGSQVEQETTALRQRLVDLGAVGVRAILDDPLDVEAMNAVWQAVVTAVMTWWYEHPEQTPDQLTDRVTRLLAALVPAGSTAEVSPPARRGAR